MSEHASTHVFLTPSYCKVLSSFLILANPIGKNWSLILIYIFPGKNEVDHIFLRFYFEINTDPQEVGNSSTELSTYTLHPDSPTENLEYNSFTYFKKTFVL